MGNVVDLAEHRRRKQRLDRMLGIPVVVDPAIPPGSVEIVAVNGCDGFRFAITNDTVTWPRPPSA